jgi:hypothetical protein
MTARSPNGQVLRGARSGPNGPCQGAPRGR